MSMVFKLRALSDEDDRFIRDYELLYTSSLAELHEYISSDLGFDPQSFSSFFISGKNWEKFREFTLVDMGEEPSEYSPLPMEKITLGQLLHKNYERLIYTFDPFEDRSLFIELIGSYEPKEGKTYPLTSLAEGEAPEQFKVNTSASEASIFDEAMDDYFDFEADESYDDDYF